MSTTALGKLPGPEITAWIEHLPIASLQSLAVWFVMLLVVVIVTMIGCGVLRLRRIPTALVVTLTVMAVAASLWLAREHLPPRPVRVEINAPRGAIEISGTRIAVSGTVEPRGAVVILLVRSEQDLNWWAQDTVTTAPGPGNVGTWSVDARLGTDKEGSGRTFLLVALASDDNRLFNLLTDRWVAAGSAWRRVPRWSRSELAVVRRVE